MSSTTIATSVKGYQIGRFLIVDTIPGHVWITDCTSGEGGNFDENRLEEAIAAFFAKEF